MYPVEPLRSGRPIARVFVFLALLGLYACTPSDSESEGARPLRLAYLPGEEDPEGRMRAFSGLAAYLTEQMGQEVELIQAVSYAPTIEAMRAGKIDFMRAGGPFTYMIAHEKAGAEAIVRVGTSTGPGLYQSAIVAWPGSGITTFDELLARAAEIDFAFVDPASTSGHLLPRAKFEQHGLDVDRDFARTIFTMNHTNSAMTIVSGKVQAGAISLNTYELLIERGLIEPEDMNILWTSEPIPSGPVMVRADLPKAVKASLQRAYLDLNGSDSALFEAMKKVYRKEDLRFYPAGDGDFDGLRTIARNVETFEMLPEG